MKRFSLKLVALLLTCSLCLTACTVTVNETGSSSTNRSSNSSTGSSTNSATNSTAKISSSNIKVSFTSNSVNENYSTSAYGVNITGRITNTSSSATAKTVSIQITLYDEYGTAIPYPYGTITIPDASSTSVTPSSITNLRPGSSVSFSVKNHPVKKSCPVPASYKVTKITVS